MSARYRCCEHCKDDTVHAVETDDHEVPCNAPRSRDCVGRTVTLPAPIHDRERQEA